MPQDVVVTALFGGLLGLLIGSFLNVVIYRLPLMMERESLAMAGATLAPAPAGTPSTWRLVMGDRPAPKLMETIGQATYDAVAALPRFNLLLPASRCGGCGHRIRWYENIPILSYLFLRGRCSACHTHISLRYPLVELVTALLFAWCAWRWGLTGTGAAWAGFAAALVALTLIDWDTTLLPDAITLPLVWAGLLAALTGLTALPVGDAVWGAVAGYLSLWLVYWAFKLATGKEGMGYGDFKLFAALGAWFGWQALVPIILMASVIGALVGIGMKLTQSLRAGGVIPFGPFLAMAGLTAMVFGPQAILRAVGL